MNEQTLDQELQDELDQRNFVQDVVNKVYPHVATNLGPSAYFDEIPPVELWKDIYARLSGIPGSTGEESESSKAQFDEHENMIYIYYPNMADEEDVISSLLHEYTHHLQDPEKWEEYREKGYDNNPYEIASRKAEENWKDYLIYLQDNPPVNIGDTVKITETKLKSNSDLLNETLLVIGFEDDGTPVTVNENDTLLESIIIRPTTINLVESEMSWFKNKSITDEPRKLNESTTDKGLIQKFLKDFWPKHRSRLYSQLYNTYHASNYVESFNRPSSNFEDALEIVADAVHEGKKLGLLDSSVDWSDIVHYDDYDYSTSDLRLIDDNGIPTLNNKLEIMDNTNLDWIHGILLFDVLEDIVEEFRCYCGENGVDPNCEGKCMDEFPPTPVEGTNKPENSGTLKQDYYTLFNYMRELERAGIPVNEYMKSPLFPNIIKLVDDGTTDYNVEGGERTSEDWDNTRTQIEFEMDAPDRLDEAFYEDEEGNEAIDPQFLRLMSNVKKLMEYDTYKSFEGVLIKYFGYNWPETTAKIWLILQHNMEVVYPGTTLDELLNNKKLTLKFPKFYEYWVRYKDSYSSHQREEECDSEGYGEESGEDCECDKAIKYVKSEDGYEEEEDCTDEWNDDVNRDECECEDFAYKDVEVYYYPLIEVQILSTIDAEEMLGYNADYQEFEDFLEDRFVKLSEDTDDYELEEDAQTWDYFGDSDEGEIYESGVDYEEDGVWYINSFMREILGKDKSSVISEQYQHTTPLKNQTDEQLSLFPTGTWEFPVGWDEESIEAVIEGVPEKAIPYIFKQWDQEGINFRDLKLLGVTANSEIAVFLLKRYLQNTTKPVIASHVFACDDLANLFDDTNRDYDLSYIKEFLCGDDSFWDSQDWYNYEWEDYMTDQIDENNWKTISEIFGGVSQSDAEDILNRSSSSEEVDELTEKYDEEIDEIRTFIVWAHNDEHEWAVKDGMKKDILDKLADHFGADGEIYRSDEDGSYSWHFEDDLRSWVNDGNTWDNIERFEFHPDYAGTTLEDSLIDTSPQYLNEKTLFAALIDEEYMFHDYCEGKKGECLQVDTKFFDGYWHPDYDINESLQDRLGELTYEPQITSGPEGEIKPLHEQEEEKFRRRREEEGPILDETPFTPLDIRVLNMLSKEFTEEELRTIWRKDESEIPSLLHASYSSYLKLFGEKTTSWEEWARATRFAKWADDNRDEAAYDIDGEDNEIDFGKVTNPVKEWPSMYEVEATESYWAKEYRHGMTDIPGYGRENAEERAEDSWYEYDVDMEYGDQGDTEDHDIEIDSVSWQKSLKEAKIRRLLREQDTPKKELNPEVQEGDVIKLVYMDDPWANISPGTLGVVMGFPDKYKIMVSWIVGKDKMKQLPLLRDIDVYMLSSDTYEKYPVIEEQINPEEFEGVELPQKREDGTEEDTIYNDPFTPLELRIVNQLHKNFQLSELKEISNRTPHEYGQLNKRYWDVLKLFGITVTTSRNNDSFWDNTRKSVYARLAYDNWTEDGNYKDIEAPIRTPLKWYNVHKDESGSQIEYKSGEARIAAFDEEGAEEKAEDDFYDWGGEMETMDYGDYETYDEEITAVEFDGLAEQRSLNKWKQKLLEQKQNKKIDEWLDEKSKTLKEAQEDRKTGKDLEDSLTSENGYEVHEPFTRKEVIILNHLIKYFTIDELNQIWESDESILASGITKRYINSVKLFGIPTEIGEQWAFSTRFARWAVDNHKEAQGEDMGDDSIDYSRVGTAIKAYPSMYEVTASNKFWQHTTEEGDIEIPAYDVDDASEKAYNAWWDYDPDMENVDWGDTDDHEMTIDNVHHNRILQTEESDVFGQGLLDPIDPEEFEGDEEEWEKLIRDVEDDEPEDIEDTEPTYDYQGGKTDPSKGFVAPSAEVTNNICKVKGFCTAQGPITFGQLRELVEAATSKRIKADMGRGIFKTLWRIIPFFVPQILLAAVGITVTRAINKIITPALTDTRGYKEWWGKLVLKAMDVAEGDYVPDIALGDDPLSKIFFISDGLMQMIRDKYKLKFARYVADYAAARPDDEPVPEWFVENLLRDYLNQKFLLDPPLPIKQGIDKKELTEDEKIGDWKDEILRHEEQLSANEKKYKKIADKLDRASVTIPVRLDDGEEPEIGWTDITFTLIRPYIFQGLRKSFLSTYDDDYGEGGKEPTVIKYDLVFTGVEPGSFLEELLEENSLEGEEGLDARERLLELLNRASYEINHALINKYFRLYGISVGRMDGIYDSQSDTRLTEQRDNWQEDNPFSKQTHDDTKLNISPEKLIKYLDTYHRERLIKEMTPTLHCIVYNCYDGWKDDPDNEWDEDEVDFDEMAQGYCGECGDELNAYLEKIDQDLVKLGFAQEHDDDEYDKGEERKTWLEKPFPYSFNVWIDGVIKEINPRFYVDVEDNVSYIEDRMMGQPPLFEHKEELNQPLTMGDVIRVVDVDKESEYNLVYPSGEPAPVSRGMLHGEDTYPKPMGLYAVMSKSMYRTNDREYLHPYWMLWPVDDDGKVLAVKDFHEIILTDKDTWITVKKHHSKTKLPVYYDSGRNITSRRLDEHNQPGLSPDLEVDDIIRVIDVDGEHARMPERWGVYKVKEIKQDNATQEFYYDIVPVDVDCDNLFKCDYINKIKTLYWGDTWIPADIPMATNVDRKTISEQKDSKLNPELMVGDEILVVSTEGIHDFGAPKLYTPYVVVGIKHGTTMNREIHNWTHGEEDEEQTPDRWDSPEVQRSRLGFRKEFDTIPYTYYQIEPIGMTDEERTGAMLAGGGRMKPMYIFPSPSEYRGSDQWILRPGFRRGELNESTKNFDSIPFVDTIEYGETMNPKPNVGDKIILIDKAEALQAFEANQPELFAPYVVISKHDYNFQIVKVDEYDYWKGWVERGSDEVPSPQKIFYPLDYKWIDADRKNINEHKKTELSPELEVGDIIRVIDIDREVESNTLKYNIPLPEVRPEMFVSYEVVEKKSNGYKSKWPFHYILVPEGQVDEYEKSGDRYEGYEKLLYPWIYQWIYADTPTASKVDRLTLSEHKKYNIAKSDIQGEGVFATHDIEKGEFIGVPISDENKFAEFVRTRNDKLDTRSDLAKKLNHQSENNCIVKSENNNLNMYAQNDIKKGDEITVNYNNSPWYINKDTTGFKESINEHKEKFNPPIREGDIIRVLDVDKDSEYEKTDYGTRPPYEVRNFSRVQLYGEETFPSPMSLYIIKTPHFQTTNTWILSPVEEVSKTRPTGFYIPEQPQYDFVKYDGSADVHDKIMTNKDTWIMVSPLPDMKERIKEALNDLVYRDEPPKRHKKRMSRDLGTLNGFPIHKFKNMPPPENESDTTEEEIGYLDNIPVDNTFVESADDIDQHFKSFLNSKGLEYPEEELKIVMKGVRGIILILKYHYNRPRPWQIANAKGLKLDSENLKSASTPSYPSGHATQGRFIGRYLADLYPEYGAEFIKIGDDIAYSRNMAKVHYPSDSEFGKVIGDEMYEYVHQPEKELELSESRIHIEDSSHPYSEQQYSDFVDFVVTELGIENPPPIRVEVEPTSTYTTGYYNNKKEIVKVRGYQRQLADILRSIAHELVHHQQKEEGLIQKPHPQIGGPIEDEANSMAGRLVKTYGKIFPEIYSLLQEQYEKPENRKKVDLTTQMFKVLDDNFGIYPHPEGELNYEGKNMQLYSYDHEAFVPVEALYHTIPNMLEGGIPQEDATLLIDILTDWVNNRITFKEPQLNEQTEEKTYRIREMLDTDNYKIVVPLDPESFCSLVPKDVCADPTRTGRWDYLISEGTPYFLSLKKTNERFILQDRGKVPFLRDEKSNYTFYKILDKTLDWATIYDMKKLFSDKPELIEFFDIKYSKSDLIKFDMIQTEEDIRKLVVGEFAIQIFKIMNSDMSTERIEEILWDFAGEGVDIETGDVSTWNSFDGNDILNVYVGKNGVSLQMEENIYHDKVVSLHEDDDFYYRQAKNLYYDDPFEEVEDTEIDYIAHNFTKDTLDKWNEVMGLLGEKEYIKANVQDFDEGDILNPMESHGGPDWDDVANDITTELGYGIGAERAKEMKSHLESEMLFEDEYYNSGVIVDLTWTQLLWVINYSEARSFEELMQESWNSIESGLSDIWYDGYGYSDEIGESINIIMNNYLTALLDNKDGLKKRRANLNNLIKILENLQFKNITGFHIMDRQTVWVDKEQQKQVQIMNFDNDENMVDIKVSKLIDGNNKYQDYRIKPEELSDYVLSDDMFAPEKAKELYGTWGLKYL